MNKIYELRERRARLWDETKVFLDTHRNSDGFLSAQDEAIYEKMEADVVQIGKEIERLETQAHIDASLVRPAKELNCCEEKQVTVCATLQEAYKIMNETCCVLEEVESIMTGDVSPNDVPLESPNSVLDNARKIVGISYNVMQKVKKIKGVLM